MFFISTSKFRLQLSMNMYTTRFRCVHDITRFLCAVIFIFEENPILKKKTQFFVSYEILKSTWRKLFDRARTCSRKQNSGFLASNIRTTYHMYTQTNIHVYNFYVFFGVFFFIFHFSDFCFGFNRCLFSRQYYCVWFFEQSPKRIQNMIYCVCVNCFPFYSLFLYFSFDVRFFPFSELILSPKNLILQIYEQSLKKKL